MFTVALAMFISSVLLFGFVLLFGAPFLPTLKKSQADALTLLDLKPGQTLVELGSGDGRMLAAAAKQGINVIGYELNPILVAYSRLATWRYRKQIKIKWANFWRQPLPDCEGIYAFLLDPFMTKLHNKITQEITSSVKLVSYAFKVPGKQPLKELDGMYLYKYTTDNKDNRQAPRK